jgi:phage terminase large subunit-like protein
MSSTYPAWIYDGSPIADPFGYGQRAVDFLRLLRHPKSTVPGRSFQLDAWQERIIRAIYGPRHADGTRIVSTVVLLLPRGNRKTSLAAALSLLHTIGPERVPGGEALFAAADRKQASIGFREAQSIIHASGKRFVEATKVSDQINATKQITYRKDGSKLETISADGARQHGRTPNFALADELHIWKSRDLWDAIQTGLDKVDNSLLVIATTAGRGQDNIAWEKIEDARKVARGEIVDPSILPVLFEAPADVDWRSEEEWTRYNPGLVHGYPSLDGFRRHRDRAERSPTERESLLQLKLNVWLDKSTSPFVDMVIYDKGATPIDMKALAGRPCWVGVDMSTTTDLTAVVAAFADDDGGFTVLPHFFCPADNLRQRGERDGVPYPAWAEAGHITPTPGNVIDYRAVEHHIRHLAEIYDVREIGFDPAYAAPVMLPLQDDGFPVVTIRQGWVTQSPALNVLERAIVGEKFRHGGHPVLRWNFSNVAIHTDSAGNRTMHKGKSTDRIDGAAGTWMACSRAASGDHGASIYTNTQRRPSGIMFF